MSLNKILIFSLIFGFFSCEKELVLDIDGANDQIVINSLFNPDEVLSASVTKSMSPLNPNLIEELSTAEVKLYENNVFKEIMTYYKSPDDVVGKFYSTFNPELGENYSIKVKSGEKEASTVNDMVPVNTPINSSAVNWIEWGDSTNIIRYLFDITFVDPPGASYYYFNAFFPVYELNESSGNYEFFANQYLEIGTNDLPNHQLYINNSLLFNDEGFNGEAKQISGTVTTFTQPSLISDENEQVDRIINKSKLYIQFHSVSDEGYKFHSSYAKEFSTAVDIYSEPTVVYSNIENGLGIFAGENITPLEIEIVY